MAKHIFVVGNNRSGTKWISNTILRSARVAGAQSEDHKGILETNVLFNAPRIFGPLQNSQHSILLWRN